MYGHHHDHNLSSQPQQVPNPLLSPSPSSSSCSSISANNNTNNNGFSSSTAKYQDVVQSSDLFWEKLKAFHNSSRTKFMVPTVGGKALDLHRLFVEVTSRGGLEKVLKDRKWKEVVTVFNFPSTITSASFVLRKYYQSLLYHFEQVYYFNKEVLSISIDDPVSRNLANESRTSEEVPIRNQPPSQATPELQPGSSVNGAIDGKFENGYLITVNLGSEQLQGVLYHVPLQTSQSSYTSDVRNRRNRKKSRLASRDPSRPKSNRSGYNFFFAEHYARLKPMYHGQEKAISKTIGLLWNNLTDAEKQVYQDKGLRDKERYKNEMLEYKSSSYNATTNC